MLHKALDLLKNELNNNIPPRTVGRPEVISFNISQLENSDQNSSLDLENHLILSLVNLEEESTLKNGKNSRRALAPDGSESLAYFNRPVYLNLYILFCSFYQSYDISWEYLSKVIAFFQQQNVFNVLTAPSADPTDPEVLELNLRMELYTLTFEQINYLWGALGGKQLPSVMYKCRLVAISGDKAESEGKYIEQIQGKENIF